MKFTETRKFEERVKDEVENNRLTIDEYFKYKEHVDGIEKKIRDCVSDLEINCYNVAPEIWAHVIMTEHRTHQQTIMKNLYRILKAFGEGGSDGRNQVAVDWAKKATSEQIYFPYI